MSSRLTFQDVLRKKRRMNDEETEDEPQEQKKIVIVEPHVKVNEGPYKFNELKK